MKSTPKSSIDVDEIPEEEKVTEPEDVMDEFGRNGIDEFGHDTMNEFGHDEVGEFGLESQESELRGSFKEEEKNETSKV